MALTPPDKPIIDKEYSRGDQPNAAIKDVHGNFLTFESQMDPEHWYVQKGVLHCQTPSGSHMSIPFNDYKDGRVAWNNDRLNRFINSFLERADGAILYETPNADYTINVRAVKDSDVMLFVNNGAMFEKDGQIATGGVVHEYTATDGRALSFRDTCNAEFRALGFKDWQQPDIPPPVRTPFSTEVIPSPQR